MEPILENSPNNFQEERIKKYLETLPNVTTAHTNLLLIDNTVHDNQLFVDSCNESTYPLVYNQFYNSKLILDYIIGSFNQIDRIGIVCYGQENIAKFLNNEPFDSTTNIQFMEKIINKFGVKTIDFLACDTLKYTPWINYYNQLQTQMGITVGASNDKTGNIKYGGDWILESTENDIKAIYWTNLIENYSALLDNLTTIDNINYSYNTSNHTASIVSANIIIAGSITIDKVTIDTDKYTITSIGDSAFQDCTGLTSVTIGVRVTSIGDGAFWNCTVLTSVTIGDSVKSIGDAAFRNCTGLTSVTIGDSVTSIGYDAFLNCTGLTSVTIGDSVTSIGYDAFWNCTEIRHIYIKTSNINNIYTNKFPTAAKFYVPYQPASATFDNKDVIYLPSYVLNTAKLPPTAIKVLSEHYYLTLNKDQNGGFFNGYKKFTKLT